MYAPTGVKTSADYPIPEKMKAWVLGDPGQLSYVDKKVPVPQRAEVLVREQVHSRPIRQPKVEQDDPRLVHDQLLARFGQAAGNACHEALGPGKG